MCGARCRLEHQGPTSHEVGMQENRKSAARAVGWSIKDPLLTKWVWRNQRGHPDAACRLEHQGPTSHEVGMQKIGDLRRALWAGASRTHFSRSGYAENRRSEARAVGWSIKDPL